MLGVASNKALAPGYQMAVCDMAAALRDVQASYQEGAYSSGSPDLERHIALLTSLVGNFEHAAAALPAEMLAAHQYYARQLLHPYLYFSPFFRRVYEKPLGYPGDYEMVNMMLYRSRTKAKTDYGEFIDSFHLNAPAPSAHRNRIGMLVERLKKEAARTAASGFRVLSVGCGPAAEVVDFVQKNELAEVASITLWDFNQETMDCALNTINQAAEIGFSPRRLTGALYSIEDIIKDDLAGCCSGSEPFDMIYCAGLFDYFSDPVCKKLIAIFCRWLNPGGLLSITNVHRDNPHKHYMAQVMDWPLVHRNTTDMAALAPKGLPCIPQLDDTGMNIFLDLRSFSCH